MTRAARFRWWQSVTILLGLGQPVALIISRRVAISQTTLLVALGLFEIPILALLALLLTTPPDAIRFSPRRSNVTVIGGTFLLQFALLIVTPMHDEPRGALRAIAICAISIVGTFVLNQACKSPWWIVLATWNPLLLALPRLLR